MNTKTIIAALVGAVASFLLGWVIWGMLLMDYFTANTIQYPGLMLPETETKLWAIFISNLSGSFMFAWLFSRMNVKTLAAGAQTGAIINIFIAISIDMMFYSMMNWYANTTIIVVDILVNAFFGAVIGGVIALMLGRGEKAAV